MGPQAAQDDAELRWTDGEGYELEGDRDRLGELVDLLADGEWRTLEEMRAETAWARTTFVTSSRRTTPSGS